MQQWCEIQDLKNIKISIGILVKIKKVDKKNQETFHRRSKYRHDSKLTKYIFITTLSGLFKQWNIFKRRPLLLLKSGWAWVCRLGQGLGRGDCPVKSGRRMTMLGKVGHLGERGKGQQGGMLRGWWRESWEPLEAQQHKRDFGRRRINQRILKLFAMVCAIGLFPLVTPALSLAKAALLTSSFIWKWILRGILKRVGWDICLCWCKTKTDYAEKPELKTPVWIPGNEQNSPGQP